MKEILIEYTTDSTVFTKEDFDKIKEKKMTEFDNDRLSQIDGIMDDDNIIISRDDYNALFTTNRELKCKLDECIQRYEEMLGLCNKYHAERDALKTKLDIAMEALEYAKIYVNGNKIKNALKKIGEIE